MQRVGLLVRLEYCKVSGKPIYTKKSALSAKNKRLREGAHRDLREYECPHCGGWHLTHKKKH